VSIELTFGPVPSRRLGRSLGINNIPPKTCSYSCVYCQIGRTLPCRVRRRPFYNPAEVISAAEAKVASAQEHGEKIDYLTVVPDGEPTLDSNLGRELWQLCRLGIRTAVITNASLLWQEEVRTDLSAADWVSVKVDAVDSQIWRRVNRPYPSLRMATILEGVRQFAAEYPGELVTETMLVAGINDSPKHLEDVAGFIATLSPQTAYLSVPTRPPAVSSVHPPDEESITRAYEIFNDRIESVECLTGYEGNAFAATGNPVADLLSITAVHPMKEAAVQVLLSHSKSDWSVVDRLVTGGALVETSYQGERFYARALNPGTRPGASVAAPA
jgi:wyosine [tRNA(Phe)-imidazoG37] synthetase (radical SAM superfamily)